MTTSEAKPEVTPDDLLKAAVSGKAEETAAPEPVKAEPAKERTASLLTRVPPRLRRFAVPAATLAAGAVLGTVVTGLARPGAPSADAVAVLGTTIDAGRTETARLAGDIAQLHHVLADLRASTDTARKEANARSSALGERLAQLDKALAARAAALTERVDQVEREHATRVSALASQLQKPVAKPEPTQTGSLPDPRTGEAKVGEPRNTDGRSADGKPGEAKSADARAVDARKGAAPDRPQVLDGWAVRDVYDGAAILENRRRRLVEVAPGDILPGVGRVEGVERHGRDWVVVTRQGLVTAQPW
jgi:hypothetical protein